MKLKISSLTQMRIIWMVTSIIFKA